MSDKSKGTVSYIIVTPDSLSKFAADVFTALGLKPEHASIMADQILWAEMRGHSSLGAKKILQYAKRLISGATNAHAEPVVVSENSAFIHYDGENSFGQIAGQIAMNKAVEKAKTSGACVASVKNTGNASSLGYFTNIAVKRRMIGFALNNAPPLMPVYGGSEKIIGNQAFAIGAPAGGHKALQFDTALSEASLVELHKYEMAGKELPLGKALDAQGRPTTDPTAALAGMLVPLAGHRGSGLAIMWEVLTGVLAGGEEFLSDVTMPYVFDRPQGTSMFFLAINPEAVMPYEEFICRMDSLLDRIHGS